MTRREKSHDTHGEKAESSKRSKMMTRMKKARNSQCGRKTTEVERLRPFSWDKRLHEHPPGPKLDVFWGIKEEQEEVLPAEINGTLTPSQQHAPVPSHGNDQAPKTRDPVQEPPRNFLDDVARALQFSTEMDVPADPGRSQDHMPADATTRNPANGQGGAVLLDVQSPLIQANAAILKKLTQFPGINSIIKGRYLGVVSRMSADAVGVQNVYLTHFLEEFRTTRGLTGLESFLENVAAQNHS